MENYKDELNKYNITLRICAGCGSRAQPDIDNAYETLSNAWSQLTQQEKIDNPLPQKNICENDGTGGISSGVSTLADQEGCTIV